MKQSDHRHISLCKFVDGVGELWLRHIGDDEQLRQVAFCHLYNMVRIFSQNHEMILKFDPEDYTEADWRDLQDVDFGRKPS